MTIREKFVKRLNEIGVELDPGSIHSTHFAHTFYEAGAYKITALTVHCTEVGSIYNMTDIVKAKVIKKSLNEFGTIEIDIVEFNEGGTKQ